MARQPIRIGFAGDLLFGGEWPAIAKGRRLAPLHPFSDVASELKQFDLFIVNLEGPLTQTSSPRENVGVLLSNESPVLDVISSPAQTVCVLANNHMMDYGAEALQKTIALLKKHKIKGVGAGLNAKEASQAVFVEANGWRIGILACASEEPEVGALIATDSTAGCASWQPVEALEERVKAARKACDLLIVSLHWGCEFYEYPKPAHVNAIDRLVAAGADIIVGHHPHVLQGLEQRGNSAIFYSLGHFFVSPFLTTAGREVSLRTQTRQFAIAVWASDGAAEPKIEIRGGKISRSWKMEFYDPTRNGQLCRRMRDLAQTVRSPRYEQFWQEYSMRHLRRLRRQKLTEDTLVLARHPLSETKRYFRKLLR